jgi:lysophospholipase L1-like esterase
MLTRSLLLRRCRATRSLNVMLGALGAAASTLAPRPVFAETAAGSPSPLPASPSLAQQRLEEYRRARTPIFMNDFGELGRYRRANAALKPPAAGESRVVFLGDSITDMWPLASFFPGKPYVNRGIGGQTTPQILVRFRPDVIALAPKVVVILAGTNDIAGNSGPMSIDESVANITSMAELARAHGVRVVIASVLPVHHYTPQSELTFPLRPMDKIRELNARLRALCAAGGHVYLDYFSAMIDGQGFLKRELAEDGLHPNRTGQAIMARLAQPAIDAALAAAGK